MAYILTGFFIIIFSFSNLFNQVQQSDDYTPLIQFLSKDKNCIKLFSGHTECLSFKNKEVFILPYFDSITNDIFFVTNKKEFDDLEADIDLADEIRKYYGQKIKIKQI